MKRILLALAFLSLLLAGCSKAYDDSAITKRISDLETLVRDNAKAIARLQKILDNATAKGMTVTVTPVEGGDLLTFSDGTSVIVLDGEKGERGEKGDKGDRGDKGDPGTPGTPGSDATISIEESADGSSYIITAGDKTYTIRKGQTFALKLTTTEIQLGIGESVEVPYTLTDEDGTTHVYVATQAGGYTARVNEADHKVIITAPAVLPEKGFIVVTASKNSTGETSSQYISFVKGTLEVVADTELVEAEGGIVTLTVTADSDYTVIIPEDCTWAHQVATKAEVKVTEAYIKVDKNTVTEPRSVTVTVHSPAGDKLIAITQQAATPDESDAFTLHPEDADEKIAAIQAMSAADLSGKAIHFTAGTYTLSAPLSLSFTEEVLIPVTIEGEEGAILDGQGKNAQLIKLGGVDAQISGLTCKNAAASALYVDRSNVTVNACTFSDNNVGSQRGGAIFMSKSLSTLKVTGSSFSGNKARYGGDIYMVNGNLTVESCTFTGSEASYTGAVLNISGQNSGDYYDSEFGNSKATMKDCTFQNCKAGTGWTDTDDAPSGVICCATAEIGLDGCVFDSCEGKSGTAVSLSSRTSRWGYVRGMNLLKMNGCVIRNCSVTRLGLIYMNADGWDASKNRSVAFVNNTSFYNNSSSTGDFGTIAHSGGNGGAILLNNCTIYKETVPETSQNGFAFNTDGCILLSNSTMVTETTVGLLRNGDTNGSVKFINSIGINTGTKAANAKEFGFTGTRNDSGNLGDDARNTTSDGHCIIGPSFSSANSFSDPVTNATLESLTGFNWNEANGVIEWNGPAADFSKAAASDFKAQIAGFGPSSPMYTGTAGDAFYSWLEGIGAIGKDALGKDRGTSWWPGAYQN